MASKQQRDMARRTSIALQDLHVGEGDVTVVSSRALAERFGREHRSVLASIRDLDLPRDFNEQNFMPVTYRDAKGQDRPEYMLTQDGATFLVMGWTGAEANLWKIAYINAFNAMRRHIQEQVMEGLPPIVRMALKPEPSEWSQVWDTQTTRSLCRLYDIPMEGDKQPRGLASIYAKLYKAMLSEPVYTELKRRNPEPCNGSNHHQHLDDRVKDEVRRAHMFTRYAADVCGKNKEAFWEMISEYHGRNRQIAIFARERN